MTGSDQSARTPPALSPASFLVDETTLSSLLAMTRDYADALTFVGDDGAPAETWAKLLDRDVGVLMARAASLRLDAHSLELVDDFAAGRAPEMADRLRALAAWLQEWFGALWLAEGNLEGGVSARLERQILRGLEAELKATAQAGPVATLDEFVARLGAWLDSGDRSRTDRSQHLRELRRFYFAVIEGLGRLQAAAAQELQASLDSKRHEPAAALLLAMSQVFARVQARINDYTARHLDFYYKDCLGFSPLGASLDSANLVFERDGGFGGEVTIPAGQAFVVGQGPDGSPIAFTADDSLTVSDARVMQLKTLRMERDSLISPEHQFGFVTQVKAATYDPGIGPETLPERLAASLMGGVVPGCLSNDGDAPIGMAITSPVLWLKEGERRISLLLELDIPALSGRRGEDLKAALADLKAALMKPITDAPKAAAFYRALGDLFAAWVLIDGVTLSDKEVEQIRLDAYKKRFIKPGRLEDQAAGPDEVFRPDLLTTMLAPLGPDELRDAAETAPVDGGADPARNRLRQQRRDAARSEIFATAFRVEISTATGWFEIVKTAPVVKPQEQATAVGGLHLELNLNNEDPPTVACTPQVHGPDWPGEAPTLRLTLNPQNRLFPLSLFGNPTLKPTLSAVSLAVAVEGARTMQVFNQNGQLDPGKPFQPFGPLPDTSSYLVVGSPEAARKSVTSQTFTLEWAGLPPEGFDAYYAAYGPGSGLTDTAFAVKPYILRDGRWADCGAPQPLFGQNPAGRPRARDIVLGSTPLTAHWRATAEPLVFDQNARSGFVKLQLASPQAGFGHQLYPTALAAALRPPPRGKPPPPLPNPPYVATLSRMTLSYSAKTRIVLGDLRGADEVLLIHPFGLEAIYPGGADGPHPILPRLDPDGQLLIGLSARQLQGELTLLFELREDIAVEDLARQDPRPRLDWSVLVANRWQPLDARHIVADTTHGFLSSGIVKFDLPAGLSTGSTVLPPDLYWLRLASDGLSSGFAGLQGIHVQALSATRAPGHVADTALPPGSITSKSAAIPGVLDIRQPEASTGFRRAESEAQARTRIAERLKHKARATTPWDYERLVLEAFPAVKKVRCLPNIDPRTAAPSPGSVLVVVAPAPPSGPRYETRPLQLDALELDRIAAYLPDLASPFARVTVRNATYDFIQVRCKVTLEAGAHPGDVLKRINSRIVSFLSPWRDGGYAADFDWAVRSDDLEACIREVPAVDWVGAVSLIRVWEDAATERSPLYRFEDSAVDQEGTPVAVISAERPWSLALPLADHFIEVVEAQPHSDRAPHTGIAGSGPSGLGLVPGLQIGETLIVGESL